MGCCDDLHAAIAVQIHCNGWRPDVRVLEERCVSFETVVPVSIHPQL